jgi:hypothetical protein
MRRFAVFSAVVALLMSAGLVSADTNTIDFEPPYTTGSIDNQQGWGSACPDEGILATIDQEVVANGAGAPASFGTQSWRFSNAWEDGQFGLWPFSPSLANEAGEFEAENGGCSGGTRQTHFEVEFSFASFTQAPQAELQMSTAPDRGDGARMSFIRLEDLPEGLSVDFAEYRDNEPHGGEITTPANPLGCGVGDGFFETTVATGLSRTEAHTVKLTIDFVDGPRNDVVKVYVNGTLEHTGTSWEDYFRYCEGNPTRTVDSMIFQARGATPNVEHEGMGFLIDNLSYTSSTPLVRDACKDGGWQDLTDDDGEPFKNQGQCIKHAQGAGDGGGGGGDEGAE